MPRSDTPSHVTSKLSCFSKYSSAFRTAWCSALFEITWPPRDIEHLASPSTARLHDSVPPLVKINSWLLVPRSLASLSRASSIAARAWARFGVVSPHNTPTNLAEHFAREKRFRRSCCVRRLPFYRRARSSLDK